MAVSLLDVNAQNLPLEAEFKEAFERVLKSGRFIMGPEMEAFEQECAEFLQVKHAFGVSSGTDAILLALMAVDIRPGDEVLCPAFTFFATAGCIRRAGAIPIFVDCCPICFNIDLSHAASLVTAKTKAIIPVHLFGQSADMDDVQRFANEHGLRVIEDAAQSFGARYKGSSCGTIGDFGTYSFFPSKNLGGMGDSGLLVTNDDALAAKAAKLRNHGMHPKYYHEFVGGNFRMDPLQAVMLSIKLKHYPEYTKNRQGNASYYLKELLKIEGVSQARPEDCKCLEKQNQQLETSNSELILPVAYDHNEHIWNQFTIRVMGDRRDELRDFLQSRDIGCDVYYPVPMNQQECFADLRPDGTQALPVTDRLAKEVLSIPVYPELTRLQQDEVIGAIKDFLTN